MGCAACALWREHWGGGGARPRNSGEGGHERSGPAQPALLLRKLLSYPAGRRARGGLEAPKNLQRVSTKNLMESDTMLRCAPRRAAPRAALRVPARRRVHCGGEGGGCVQALPAAGADLGVRQLAGGGAGGSGGAAGRQAAGAGGRAGGRAGGVLCCRRAGGRAVCCAVGGRAGRRCVVLRARGRPVCCAAGGRRALEFAARWQAGGQVDGVRMHFRTCMWL